MKRSRRISNQREKEKKRRAEERNVGLGGARLQGGRLARADLGCSMRVRLCQAPQLQLPCREAQLFWVDCTNGRTCSTLLFISFYISFFLHAMSVQSMTFASSLPVSVFLSFLFCGSSAAPAKRPLGNGHWTSTCSTCCFFFSLSFLSS